MGFCIFNNVAVAARHAADTAVVADIQRDFRNVLVDLLHRLGVRRVELGGDAGGVAAQRVLAHRRQNSPGRLRREPVDRVEPEAGVLLPVDEVQAPVRGGVRGVGEERGGVVLARFAQQHTATHQDGQWALHGSMKPDTLEDVGTPPD